MSATTNVFDINQPSTSQQNLVQSSSSSNEMKPKLNLSDYRRQIRNRRLISNSRLNQTSNNVIYSCSYQYYSDDYLMRIHQILSNDLDYHIGYQNFDEQLTLTTHDQQLIDEFEINTFEDVYDFELYSKQQSLNYIEQMIEKRQQEKYQDQLAQVSYDEPDPNILHATFIDPLRVEQLTKRKRRCPRTTSTTTTDYLSICEPILADEEEEDDEDDVGDERLQLANGHNEAKLSKIQSIGRKKFLIHHFFPELFTRTSSRGRVIKPKNNDQWLLDMEELDALDEIIGAYDHENDDHFDKIKSTNNDDNDGDENTRQQSTMMEKKSSPKESSSSLLPTSSSRTSISPFRAQISDNKSRTSLSIHRNYSILRNGKYSSSSSLLSRPNKCRSLLAQPSPSSSSTTATTINQTKLPLKIHNISYNGLPMKMNGDRKLLFSQQQQCSTSKKYESTTTMISSEESKFTPIVQLEELDTKIDSDDRSNDENNHPDNIDTNNNNKFEYPPDRPNNLQPAKIFSRFTPMGWKSFLISQNDTKIYEFNYGNLGNDRTVFIDTIRKIGDNIDESIAFDHNDNQNNNKNKNKKCKKIPFSFSEVPFLNRLQQSDNEFRLYLSTIPMLLNMLNHRDNEEQSKHFQEKSEKYINILGRFYEKHCQRRMKKNIIKKRSRQSLLRRWLMNDVQEQYSLYSLKPFDDVWNANQQQRLEISKKFQPIHTTINRSMPIVPKSAFPKSFQSSSSSSKSISLTPKPITVTPTMTAKVNSNGQIQLFRKEITPIKLTTHPNRSTIGSSATATAIAAAAAQIQKSNQNSQLPVVCKIPNNVGFKLHQTSFDTNMKTIQLIPSSMFSSSSASSSSTATTTLASTSPTATTTNTKPISVTSKPIIFRVQPSSSSSQLIKLYNKNEWPKINQNNNNNNNRQQQQQPPLKKIKTEINDDDEITIVHEHIPKKPIKLIQVKRTINNTKQKSSNLQLNILNDEKKFFNILKRLPLKKRRIASKVLMMYIFAAIIVKSKKNSTSTNNQKKISNQNDKFKKNENFVINNMDLD
ncbi:hypothetical protein DERP_005429 [Dermatophagoides pteronyssinus]|uniref:Uncharacterized protein n=1 Tax=Dermatophagoides pteronyssinus TaxID=6956 RepID=A0ABQ8JMK9_DERPT|nr:hypothetical protein DERP_005429 [Dermatophagoides pteronyssinus]